MDRFSDRYGYTQPPTLLEENRVTQSLRAGLWDATCMYYFCHFQTDYGLRSADFEKISGLIWFYFFKEPIDERPYSAENTRQAIRNKFFEYDFVDLYNFVEFMASLPWPWENYVELCNTVLERERTAFRFVDRKIVKIVDQSEINEIQALLRDPGPQAVKEHISQAISLYADRSQPDFRNSVKESISAVEAAARFITGDSKATLGSALSTIERTHPLHSALRDGFKKIYGYTSDAGGIRHALSDEATNVTEADARFMVVSCSAFANYLISLKAGPSAAG